MNTPVDPVVLSQHLIQCPSITPEDAGALDVVQTVLTQAGFNCTRVPREGIDNLFARWGAKGHAKTFGYNGHTDVVPTGPEGEWSHPPFSGAIADGRLWGRGACDMKTSVAAFAAAAADFVQATPLDGAIILTITGDEEGDGIHGTAALLDWMATEGEAMTACLVGEPTSPNNVGDMIKIGRRGSVTFFFTATGVQGHSAYPHLAKNPVPALARLMADLDAHVLDEGNAHFQPSTLAVTGFDTGNSANNVIPGACRAMVNIRFNDEHSSASLSEWVRAEAERVAADTGVQIAFTTKVTGESFLTPPGPLSDLVAGAVTAETGITPELSTTGGTSDARYIKDHCPVVELGLVGQTMHQVDENVAVEDIHTLKRIYMRILADYFA